MYLDEGGLVMKNGTNFPIDPGDMHALKRWLAQHEDQSMLRQVGIEEILIGTDVLFQLPLVLQRAGIVSGSRVLLVMDKTPMRREERDLKPFVQALLHEAGYVVTPLWLGGDRYGLVHADFEQVQHVHDAILPGDALVALGSGTLTDIVKHAAYLYDQDQQDRQRNIVFICCQTANSVTAFAANMAVLLKDGVKRTVPSRYPTAIIADLRVLASAPRAMTLAGLGDCCARFVAYGDWYLASALGMVDFYSEVPLGLLGNLGTILLEHAAGIEQRCSCPAAGRHCSVHRQHVRSHLRLRTRDIACIRYDCGQPATTPCTARCPGRSCYPQRSPALSTFPGQL